MKKTIENIKPVKITDNIQTLADQLLLQHFAPASVLINPMATFCTLQAERVNTSNHQPEKQT
jgi:hypothetical protein